MLVVDTKHFNAQTPLVRFVVQKAVGIGVNFCNAARFELPHFSNSKAFRLLRPPLFATCRAYYEAVFCGVPNKIWLQMTLITIRRPVCPFLWMSDPQKAFSFRGLCPLTPLTRGSAPGPHWGLRPQTPIIRSALAMVRAPPLFNPSSRRWL